MKDVNDILIDPAEEQLARAINKYVERKGWTRSYTEKELYNIITNAAEFAGNHLDMADPEPLPESQDKEEEKTCCICGKKFTGWGNNPWPIKKDGECCDECNYTRVLSARMRNAYHKGY